jgi:hypothetical protein
MLKKYKKVLLIAAAVILIPIVSILGYATTKPDTMRVQRSTSIKAPAEKIFPLISNFHNWTQWSPFESLDPALQRTYSGSSQGQGAVYEWAGNSQVGKGRMEILDAKEPSQIVIKLDFIEPFEGHMTAEFTLDTKGDATEVTWATYGPQSYCGKIMSCLIDCDAMLGKNFETGLASMKAVAEKPAE